MSKKRAQITAVLIIGILLIASVTTYYLVVDSKIQTHSKVKNSMQLETHAQITKQ